MVSKAKEPYVGLSDDHFGGMTATGKIIRDAKVFGLVDEDDDCKGWLPTRIEALNHQVDAEWDKYGCMVSQLPTELFERHQKIHKEAVEIAHKAGWNVNNELANDWK